MQRLCNPMAQQRRSFIDQLVLVLGQGDCKGRKPSGALGESLVEVDDAFNQVLGAGGWRLERSMRNHVGDRCVDLVADAAQHRFGRDGDCPGNWRSVECRQVGAGAAAANDCQHVDIELGAVADHLGDFFRREFDPAPGSTMW